MIESTAGHPQLKGLQLAQIVEEVAHLSVLAELARYSLAKAVIPLEEEQAIWEEVLNVQGVLRAMERRFAALR